MRSKITVLILQVLAVVTQLSSLDMIYAGEIMETAVKAVTANHKRADEFAKYLVEQDFAQTMVQMSKDVRQLDQVSQSVLALQSDQQKLLADFRKFASTDLLKLQMTRDQVNKFREDYRDLIRRRFEQSWVGTESAMHYENFSPVLVRLIQQFKNTCETGRSDFSFDNSINREPAPPPYQFEVMVMLGNEYNGPSYSGLNYHSVHRTRSELVQVVGTASGVASGILLSGATGAWQTAAAIGGPASAAVLLAALSVQHFANLEKANETAAKVAAAEAYKFRNTKRDDYVSGKYRELCRERVESLSEIGELIKVLESGETSAHELVSRELNRKNEMEAVEKYVHGGLIAKCRLDLASFLREGKCHSKPNGDMSPACLVGSDGVAAFSNSVKECTVKLKADGRYDGQESDEKVIEDFDTKKSDELLTHKIVIAFGADRARTLETISAVSWRTIDQEKERAFQVLMKFIGLAKKMKDEGLLSVESEVALANEFETLRRRFIHLVAHAINVVLSGKGSGKFENHLKEFDRDFALYFQKNRLAREAQGLDSSLRSLKSVLYAK